jgi:hypothetical protein
MSAMATKTCGCVMDSVYQNRDANTGTGVVAQTGARLVASFVVLDWLAFGRRKGRLKVDGVLSDESNHSRPMTEGLPASLRAAARL